MWLYSNASSFHESRIGHTFRPLPYQSGDDTFDPTRRLRPSEIRGNLAQTGIPSRPVSLGPKVDEL